MYQHTASIKGNFFISFDYINYVFKTRSSKFERIMQAIRGRDTRAADIAIVTARMLTARMLVEC